MEKVSPNLKTIRKEDFNIVCRSCLMRGPMASIFDLKYEETLFSEILTELFSTQVNSEDEMPKNICETCILEIIRFYNFRKVFTTSENILQSIITKELNRTIHSPVLYNENIQLEDFVNTITISDDDLSEGSIEISEDPDINESQDQELRPEDQIINLVSSDEDEIQIDTITTDNIDVIDDFFIDRLDSEKLQEDYFIETVKSDFQNRCVDSKKKLTKPRIFTCSCEKTFALQSEYIKHRKEEMHPRPRTHSCKICDKRFTRNGLTQHMRRHTKEKPYECKICQTRFSLGGNLRRHMMRHTGERPHVCEFCGKGFIQGPSLTAHKRIHTGEKPFLCIYCGKTFGNSIVHKLHLKKHLDCKDPKTEKSPSQGGYQCTFCQKVFATKAVLKTHLLHHGDKQFLCSYCGKSFYSKGALHSHINVHTGAKPYSCSLCYRTFAQSGSLKTHVYTHTGDKPYKCKICLKAFTQRPHLKTHLRTHSGERPYVCPFCNKNFPHSGTLQVHIRTHTGERPYVCDLCPMGFYDSSSMKRHRKRHLDGSEMKEELNLVPTSG